MSLVWSVTRAALNTNFAALLITVSTAAVLCCALYKAASFVYRTLDSPLRILPGPPNPSVFWGHTRATSKSSHSVLQEKWTEEYGPTISYNSFLSSSRLWTMDTRALQHILTNSYNYQRPPQSRFYISRVLGTGLIMAEEDQHKRQRKITSPAFGSAQIREQTEIFIDKSRLLRDKWVAEVAKSRTGYAQVDAMFWMSKAALDIIGLTSFGHDFGELNAPVGKTGLLSDAFNTIFTTNGVYLLLAIMKGILPFLRIFKTEIEKISENAQNELRRIGRQLVEEKKASIVAASGKGDVEEKNIFGRDLLTLLVKANMATDIPESQRLTDYEILEQFPTFVVVGHETTSTSLSWGLFSLTQNQDVQRKLREELLDVPTENPTMEELQALPYLDMVVKEILRYHSPIPQTNRMAMNDDVIPCSVPYTDRNGVRRDHIRVKKGDIVSIPILALNRYKPYWGKDAMEFKPERWAQPPGATAASIPGVFGNLFSFLCGPRSCIGWRFAIVEMKAILFTLVREFEFELDVPVDMVKKRTAIVQRPVVVGVERKEEGKMPLRVRRYVRV
ncbi:cytochrome P450 [Cytidiella melzeri]|nr:cytochrome P450 [Cytidiella melzeri]